MIRKFHRNDLSAVMEIWLETNIQAHSFIPQKYWMDNFEMVKDMLPEAELYVYEDDNTHQADGFIGLTDNYIAGKGTCSVKRGWKTINGLCEKTQNKSEFKCVSEKYTCSTLLPEGIFCDSV